MPRICVAGGCSNRPSHSISLHRFPVHDVKRCTLWNQFVGVKRADWVKPSAHSTLCSCHFLNSDFDSSLQHQLGFQKYSTLRDDAVPSVHAANPTKVVTSSLLSGDEPVKKKTRAADKL